MRLAGFCSKGRDAVANSRTILFTPPTCEAEDAHHLLESQRICCHFGGRGVPTVGAEVENLQEDRTVG